MISAAIDGDVVLNPNVVVAIVAGAVAVTTAAFVFLNARLTDLRKRVDSAERTNQALWIYCRRLINVIYVRTGEEPPAPDTSIAHLFPKE